MTLRHLMESPDHHSDVIMNTIASQITSVSVVYSTICSGTKQRKHQSSITLAFVWEIHRWPVNSPHRGPVTWKIFPFDDVITLPMLFVWVTCITYDMLVYLHIETNDIILILWASCAVLLRRRQVTAMTSRFTCQLSVSCARTHNKGKSKACVTGPLWGESTADRRIPAQRDSNAENVSIWWRHNITGRVTHAKPC